MKGKIEPESIIASKVISEGVKGLKQRPPHMWVEMGKQKGANSIHLTLAKDLQYCLGEAR